MNHLGEDPVINGVMTHETLRGVGFLCMAIYRAYINSSTKKLVEAHLVWDVVLKGSWCEIEVFNGEMDIEFPVNFRKHMFSVTQILHGFSRYLGKLQARGTFVGCSLDVHWFQ